MRNKVMFQIVTIENEVVCEDIPTLADAVACRKELNLIDQLDGVFEEGFYKIKRQIITVG